MINNNHYEIIVIMISVNFSAPNILNNGYSNIELMKIIYRIMKDNKIVVNKLEYKYSSKDKNHYLLCCNDSKDLVINLLEILGLKICI